MIACSIIWRIKEVEQSDDVLSRVVGRAYFYEFLVRFSVFWLNFVPVEDASLRSSFFRLWINNFVLEDKEWHSAFMISDICIRILVRHGKIRYFAFGYQQ
jgi:hypothetical protein